MGGSVKSRGGRKGKETGSFLGRKKEAFGFGSASSDAAGAHRTAEPTDLDRGRAGLKPRAYRRLGSTGIRERPLFLMLANGFIWNHGN